MNDPRIATFKDKKSLKDLWRLCFNTDSDSFISWFFKNRFIPRYCVLIEEEGKVLCALHSLPVHLNIRDKIIDSVIIAGVGTHPDFRGQGYMGKVFRYYMNYISSMGIVLTNLTPEYTPTYISLGHLPATNSGHLTIDRTTKTKMPDSIKDTDLTSGISSIYSCYSLFSKQYSGIVSRSYADFRFKLGDYLADSAKCIAYIKDDILKGYCIYYDTPKLLHAEEFVFTSPEAVNPMVYGLMSKAYGKKLHIKTPPDVKIEIKNANFEIKPQASCGVANAPSLLSSICGTKDFTVLIKDKNVLSNNGTFDFSGCPTEKEAQLTINAEHLCQWLNGYISLKELHEKNLVSVLDLNVLDELDGLLPIKKCFIVDEY
ncbi:MAG: GNAT family N-acetyltransferase [Eubacteriales bacterium]